MPRGPFRVPLPSHLSPSGATEPLRSHSQSKVRTATHDGPGYCWVRLRLRRSALGLHACTTRPGRSGCSPASSRSPGRATPPSRPSRTETTSGRLRVLAHRRHPRRLLPHPLLPDQRPRPRPARDRRRPRRVARPALAPSPRHGLRTTAPAYLPGEPEQGSRVCRAGHGRHRRPGRRGGPARQPGLAEGVPR